LSQDALDGFGWTEVSEIAQIAEAIKPRLGRSIAKDAVWTIWKRKSSDIFRIEANETRPSNAILWHTFLIGSLIQDLNEALQKPKH
jgi:hypothetical protein